METGLIAYLLLLVLCRLRGAEIPTTRRRSGRPGRRDRPAEDTLLTAATTAASKVQAEKSIQLILENKLICEVF